MDCVIKYVEKELSKLECSGVKYKTSDVRRVSSKVYTVIKHRRFEDKLKTCEELLESREWAKGVIAYDIAYRARKSYTVDTFEVFERWLKDYVRGWGDCDDFCTHALGALIAEHNELYPRVLEWCNHPDFWVRRGAAVSLIYPIKKSCIEKIDPLLVSDALMNDVSDLVLKGYGWMLKVYGKNNSDRLKEYLIKNVNEMPRVAYRYAIEKLDLDVRKHLMSL